MAQFCLDGCSLRRGLYVLALCACLTAGVGAALIYHAWQRFLHAPIALTQTTEFDIRRGASFQEVRHLLVEQGVARSKSMLWLTAQLHPELTHIMAGSYLLEPGMSMLDVLQQFADGKVHHYSLTLIEGWTALQAWQALQREPRIQKTAQDLTGLMTMLGRAGQHPEGQFYPDTYFFIKGERDIDVMRRSYQMMQQRLSSAWLARAPGLPYRDAYEALIMASIIEKETSLDHERALIAGVFVRRLQQGIPLATDPSVIYGLGVGFDGNLRRDDLLNDTPYNTYRRKGLPPTPIALPSQASIEAALQPASGDALYFVAKGDGSHHFSATYTEHLEAVKRYQISRRAD